MRERLQLQSEALPRTLANDQASLSLVTLFGVPVNPAASAHVAVNSGAHDDSNS